MYYFTHFRRLIVLIVGLTTEGGEAQTTINTSTTEIGEGNESTQPPTTTVNGIGTESTNQQTDSNTEPATQGPETTTNGNKEETTIALTEGPVEGTTESSGEATTDATTEPTTLRPDATENNKEETTNEPTTAVGNQQETTENQSETTTNIPDSPQKPSDGNSSCPPIEGDQAHFVCPTGFRRHQKDCSRFYQCTESPETSHLSIVTFNCPNGTVYDEDEIKCRERTESDNCSSPSETANSLRGTLFDIEMENSPVVRQLQV